MLAPGTRIAPLGCHVMSERGEPAGHVSISYVREDSHRVDQLSGDSRPRVYRCGGIRLTCGQARTGARKSPAQYEAMR